MMLSSIRIGGFIFEISAAKHFLCPNPKRARIFGGFFSKCLPPIRHGCCARSQHTLVNTDHGLSVVISNSGEPAPDRTQLPGRVSRDNPRKTRKDSGPMLIKDARRDLEIGRPELALRHLEGVPWERISWKKCHQFSFETRQLISGLSTQVPAFAEDQRVAWCVFLTELTKGLVSLPDLNLDAASLGQLCKAVGRRDSRAHAAIDDLQGLVYCSPHPPNERTWASLLLAQARAKKFDSLEITLKNYHEATGRPPSLEMLGILASAYACRKSKGQSAVELVKSVVWRALELGYISSFWSDRFFNGALLRAVNLEHGARAEFNHLMGISKVPNGKLDPRHFAHVLSRLVAQGYRKEATMLLKFYDALNIPMDKRTMHAYLCHLCSEGLYQEVLNVAGPQMQNLREDATAHHYETLFRAHHALGNTDSVLSIHRSLRSSNCKRRVTLSAPYYNTLIHIISSTPPAGIESPLESSFQLLEEMKELGLEPSPRTLAILMRHAILGNRKDVMKYLLPPGLAKGEDYLLAPSPSDGLAATAPPFIYSALIKALDPLLAFEIYVFPLLSQQAHHCGPLEVSEAYRRMKDISSVHGRRALDLSCWAKLIHACIAAHLPRSATKYSGGRTLPPERAQALAQLVQKIHAQVVGVYGRSAFADMYYLGGLLQVLSRCGKWAAAFEVWNRMVIGKPPSSASSEWLLGCNSSELVPTPAVLSIMIDLVSMSGRIDRLRLFEAAVVAHQGRDDPNIVLWPVDANVWTSFIEGFFRSNAPNDVVRVITQSMPLSQVAPDTKLRRVVETMATGELAWVADDPNVRRALGPSRSGD